MWKAKNGYWKMEYNGKLTYVHRYVWELYNGSIPKGFDVHHKNGNKACNCIMNLELIEHKRHLKNHQIAARKKDSGYRGVRKHNLCKKFVARIINEQNEIYLGLYHTAEEAARAYDKKAKELWGDDAFQNFKDE